MGLDDSVAYQKKLAEYYGRNISTGAAKMEALNSAGISKFSLGVGVVTTALTAVLSIYNAIEQSHEEMVQKSKQSLEESTQSIDSLEDSLSKYKELKDEIDSGNLTDSKIYDKKQQIFEIQ